MNRIGGVVLFVVLVLALQHSFGQASTDSPQQQRTADDERDEITVKGTVAEITNSLGVTGRMRIYLTLQSDSAAFQVHVGPASYVSAQRFTFARGDTIEVTGWNSKKDHEEIILARQITKHGQVLTLRDPRGSPLWAQRRGLR